MTISALALICVGVEFIAMVQIGLECGCSL